MAYAPTSTPPVTTADLESARQSLAAHIDAITDRVSPGSIAHRQSRKLRRLFKSDEGTINTRNVAVVAGVVTVLLVYAIRRRTV